MKFPTAVLMMLSILPLLPGCGPAAWRVIPEKIDAVDWSPVADDHVRWLEHQSPNYQRAVQLLNARPSVELSPEQVREFWTEALTHGYARPYPPTTRPSDGTHAYLIRGVSYDPALQCRVWSSPTNGAVWSHFQTWTEESPVYAAFSTTHGSPVIVFLNSPPSAVYVSASLQGANILKGNMSHPSGTQE